MATNPMIPDRPRLLNTLEQVRAKRCGYANSEKFCDCKYVDGKVFSGEMTGCCEIRIAMALIGNMTPKEYERIRTRKRK